MSLRKSINEKCKDCICDDKEPGTWKDQTHLCTVIDCPLWAVRPQHKKISADHAKRLVSTAERSISDESIVKMVVGGWR